MTDKVFALEARIRSLGRVAIAFSGGADSSLLLRIASEYIGKENVVGIYVETAFAGEVDKEHVRSFQGQYAVHILPLDVLTGEVLVNTKGRCMACRRLIFAAVREYAKSLGFFHVADGFNCDDVTAFSEGLAASDELSFVHPFLEAGFFKDDIVKLGKQRGYPRGEHKGVCYARHIAVGEFITPEKLSVARQVSDILTRFGLDSSCFMLQNGQVTIRAQERMEEACLAAFLSELDHVESQDKLQFHVEMNG